LRNLPRRDFLEPELKELLIKTLKDYFERYHEGANVASLRKIIKQVKVMRDKEKTATSEGGETTQLASGLAFAEFSEHKYAMHVVNYLNNIQLNNSRNLIVDFALDDARKVRLRQQRMDKQKEATKKNQAN
jgi:RNA recognition motif-containing protein